MSFSALATLALGAALVIPLLLPAIALYERIIDPRTKLSRSRTALCVAVVLWLECLGLVAAAALWVFFLGRRRHPGWDSAHHRLQWGWAKLNFSALKKIFGLELQVTAAEQGQAGPYLLLLNHTSIADTLLASIVLSGPYGMAFRYVLREGLLWDPCLDVVGLRLPNVFLSRERAHRHREMEAIAALAGGLGHSCGLLIYPEGTRFRPDKLRRALERRKLEGEMAELAGAFTNVMPPKPGGVMALLRARPDLDVVFLEHVGLENAVSIRDFWGGNFVGRTIHVRVRRVPRDDIPEDDVPLWLFREWAKVDEWVGSRVVEDAAALPEGRRLRGAGEIFG